MKAARPLALITGGTRRLGAAIAAKLWQEGYDLALSAHRDGDLDPALAQILRGAENPSAAGDWKVFRADLSRAGVCETLIGEIMAHFGRPPGLLVNNAAIFGQDDWRAMNLETLEAHFRLNLFAPLLLARALVDAVGAESRPVILHILDQRIVNPNGDQISYTLSKQALAASVRSMASAFGGRARVNAVAPGLVMTNQDYDAALEQRLAVMMPLGGLPTPGAVADAVHYLAGADHVSGQIIFVDGGANLKSFDRDFMYL